MADECLILSQYTNLAHPKSDPYCLPDTFLPYQEIGALLALASTLSTVCLTNAKLFAYIPSVTAFLDILRLAMEVALRRSSF